MKGLYPYSRSIALLPERIPEALGAGNTGGFAYSDEASSSQLLDESILLILPLPSVIPDNRSGGFFRRLPMPHLKH